MAPIQFGILMVPYQTLDVAAPLDVLTSCSKDGLKEMEAFGWPGTAGITEKAIDIKFHHINDTMDPVTMTGGVKILPTTTIDNCPELDYLLVGGPDPVNYQLSEAFADFLRKHVSGRARTARTRSPSSYRGCVRHPGKSEIRNRLD